MVEDVERIHAELDTDAFAEADVTARASRCLADESPSDSTLLYGRHEHVLTHSA